MILLHVNRFCGFVCKYYTVVPWIHIFWLEYVWYILPFYPEEFANETAESIRIQQNHIGTGTVRSDTSSLKFLVCFFQNYLYVRTLHDYGMIFLRTYKNTLVIIIFR